MGYRSDVCIVVVFPEKKQRDDFIMASLLEASTQSKDSTAPYADEIKRHWATLALAESYERYVPSTVVNAPGHFEVTKCAPEHGLWAVLIKFMGIKWYDSYPEVEWYNNISKRLEAQSVSHVYGFFRVGEDTKDIEEDIDECVGEDSGLEDWSTAANEKIQDRFGIERTLRMVTEDAETIEDFLKEGEQS